MMWLMQGDCLERMVGIQDDFVDLTVTSPPYDKIRNYNGFTFDYKSTLKQLHRITKFGGVVVWIVADQTVSGSETGSSFRQALYAIECGFFLHDTMIWQKSGCNNPVYNRYHNCFEYMFIFSKGKPKTTNLIYDRENKTFGKKMSQSTRRNANGTIYSAGIRNTKKFGKRFNIWQVNQVNAKELCGHPAQFPVKLAKDHIISWSNQGDIILDPLMGSGTTGVAALQTGRDFIGIELDENYFRIAENRIREAQGNVHATCSNTL